MQDMRFHEQAMQSHTVQYRLHLKELKLTVRKAEAA